MPHLSLSGALLRQSAAFLSLTLRNSAKHLFSLGSLFYLGLLLVNSSPVLAQSLPPSGQALNPCALFYQLQQGKSYTVVKVQVLGVKDGLVATMVLGLPRNVLVDFNGIDVSSRKVDSQQIICGREAVGELSSYDVSGLNMDAGFFQIRADHLKDSRSIQLRK